MDIRYRFAFKQRFILEDSWPLRGQGAVVELESADHEVTHITVTFSDQPVSLAPRITTPQRPPETTSILVGGHLESTAKQIVRRFQHFLGIHHTIDIDFEDVESEYIPKNEEERKQIQVFSFKTSRSKAKSRVSFSMVAQAFFATESSDDPSFTVSFLQLAREASLEQRYIDAFRYCFLLFESLYGEGKFKTQQLVDAMAGNVEFASLISRTIADFRNDPLHRNSPSQKLIEEYPLPRAMIEHLVDRRGFFFHGNNKRPDPWRPDEQHNAEPISAFCMFVALAVADSQAGAMFHENIGRRYFENAQEFEAIMPIVIRYSVRDEHDFVHERTFRMNTPATVATNELALRVQIRFLDWAQTELHGTNLVSATATDEKTGCELFSSHYISPAPPNLEEGVAISAMFDFIAPRATERPPEAGLSLSLVSALSDMTARHVRKEHQCQLTQKKLRPSLLPFPMRSCAI